MQKLAKIDHLYGLDGREKILTEQIGFHFSEVEKPHSRFFLHLVVNHLSIGFSHMRLQVKQAYARRSVKEHANTTVEMDDWQELLWGLSLAILSAACTSQAPSSMRQRQSG